MRPDEAVFYLSRLTELNYDNVKYAMALQVLLNIKANRKESDGPFAILYLDTRHAKKLIVGLYRSLYASNKHYRPIKSFCYDDIFDGCLMPSYEHFIVPAEKRQVGKEYDKPQVYFDFESLIEDVLTKESNSYFLNPDDYFLLPAFETETGYVWQVYIKEPENERYVGRMTIPKS